MTRTRPRRSRGWFDASMGSEGRSWRNSAVCIQLSKDGHYRRIVPDDMKQNPEIAYDDRQKGVRFQGCMYVIRIKNPAMNCKCLCDRYPLARLMVMTFMQQEVRTVKNEYTRWTYTFKDGNKLNCALSNLEVAGIDGSEKSEESNT